MDRIEQLKVFMRIAECGSFVQAAEQLGMPRATVSLAVQQLERRLGARLLHRTTRRVTLTLDGEALRERAAVLIADIEDLEQQFRPVADTVSGRLRVDMPSRIARRLVAPALPDFLARHPGVEIELGASDRAIDLVQDGVDCALRVGALPSSSLVARRLGVFTLINCASPAYLAQYGIPEEPDALGSHTAVAYLSPSFNVAAPWEWCEGAEVNSTQLRSRVSANNADTYIACALAGLGMIQVPAYDVREHLDAGTLVEVLPEARPAPMPVSLVYPHRHHLSRRLQAFLQWMEVLLQPYLE